MRGDLVVDGRSLSADEIAEVLGHPAMAYVPEDDAVAICGQTGAELPYAPSMRAVAMLADNLVDGGRKLYDCTDGFRGVFGRIKMFLRRQL